MKAPKNHHFSSSASLNYRVAASVAEKNTGQTYVVEVIKLDIYAVKLSSFKDTWTDTVFQIIFAIA